VSYFTRLRINYKTIKVETNELNIMSDTTNTSNSVFHSFLIGGLYCESIRLKNGSFLNICSYYPKLQK